MTTTKSPNRVEPKQPSPLKPKEWKDICSGIQAFCAIVLAGIAIYAFFFSPLSRVVEDHLRAEITAAKQELVAARDAKAFVEAEKDRLSASTEKIREARDQLKGDIAALEQQISLLGSEREAYARTLGVTVTMRYVALVKSDLAVLHKIAQICSDFDQHRTWLVQRRELAKLDEQWEKLPDSVKYTTAGDNHPLEKRRLALEKIRHDIPKLWHGMPHKPNLTPTLHPIVFDAHTVKLLNFIRENAHEEANNYLVGWLKGFIVATPPVHPITGGDFIKKTKAYDFMDQLLPKEREEFHARLDAFMAENVGLRDLQINVTTSANPSSQDIVSAGRKVLPNISAFEERFLAHLKASGMDG